MLKVTTKSNQISVPEDPGAVVVGSGLLVATAEFARPNDANPYTALDVVSNTGVAAVRTFANLARSNGGSGHIVKARIMTDQVTNVARYRLHLFVSAPAAIADNAPYTLLYANRAIRVAYIDFYAADDEGAGSTGSMSSISNGDGNLPLAFICAAASRSLYGILETLDAFTPANNQNYFIELTSEPLG